MAFVLYTDGIGGETGDSLSSTSPLLATEILYVDSVTGSDLYTGNQRSRPKATISGAFLDSAAGGIIVLLSTHSEVISSVVDITAKGVTIIGEGSADGYPTATIDGGNNARLMLTGDSCQLINVKFTASTTANGNSMVGGVGKGLCIRGCLFQMGASDNAGLELTADADFSLIEGCTFIATNTGVTSRPNYGLLVGGAPDGIRMSGNVFSDGTYGFANYACSAANTVSIFAVNTSLLLGAEMNTGSAYGYVHVGTSTGGGRVV